MAQQAEEQKSIQINEIKKHVEYDVKDEYFAMDLLGDDNHYLLIKRDKEYFLVPQKLQQEYLEKLGYKIDATLRYTLCKSKEDDQYYVIINALTRMFTEQSFEELKKAEIRSSKLTISDIVKCNNRHSSFDIFAVPNQSVDLRRCSESGKQYSYVVEQMINMIIQSRTEYINNNEEKIQSLLDSGSRENQIIDSIDKKLMQDRNLMNTLNNLRMTANQLYCEDQYCDNMRRSFYYTAGLLDDNNQFDINGVVKNNRKRTFFDDFTKVVLGNPNLVLNLLKWYDCLDLGLWEYFIKKEPGGDNIISINCRDSNKNYHFKKVIDLNQPYYERHYTKYKIITQDKKETEVYLPSNISPYILNSTLCFYDNKTKETYTIGNNVNEEDAKEVSKKDEKYISSSFFKKLKKSGFTNYEEVSKNIKTLSKIGWETRISTCNLFRTCGTSFRTVGPYYIQKPNWMQPINNRVVYDKKYYHMSLNKKDRKQHYNRCASWY